MTVQELIDILENVINKELFIEARNESEKKVFSIDSVSMGINRKGTEDYVFVDIV